MVSLDKLIDVISLFAPFILISLIAFMSIFHQDLKALIMIVGLFIMLFILKQISFRQVQYNLVQQCTIFDTQDIPGTSSAIFAFIFTYFLLPMLYNSSFNYPLISVLIILYLLDIYYKFFKHKCYNMLYIIISTIIGLSISVSYFYIIYSLGEDYYNLLYFNVSKNNLVQCSRASTTEYKCSFINDKGDEVPFDGKVGGVFEHSHEEN